MGLSAFNLMRARLEAEAKSEEKVEPIEVKVETPEEETATEETVKDEPVAEEKAPVKKTDAEKLKHNKG